MNKVIVCSMLSASLACMAFSQAGSAKNVIPVADGVFRSGEYRYVSDCSDMKLGLKISPDAKTLYVALSAPTTGWVAAGLGSLVMNGAHIILGSDVSGKGVISEQKGFGHGHAENVPKILTSGAVHESGGTTVLEFSVPSAGFADGSSLKLALSYSGSDDSASKHSNHASVEIPLPLQ